ncbi:MAG: T9SS type A sorting domain-containing protein [Balneolales bacterium]
MSFFTFFISNEIIAQRTIDLSGFDENDAGFIIPGLNANDRLSTAVATGDINGDGFDDLIISHPRADFDGEEEAGIVYVLFGSINDSPFNFDLNTLDGNNGFMIAGKGVADRIGRDVSTGDINGDGFDDLIISASDADPDGEVSAGETYVVFGKDGNFDEVLAIADLDGTNGFTIGGINDFDASGSRVASADINGDGFDDVILSAYGVDHDDKTDTGAIYVVFGKEDGFADTGLSQLDGDIGFTVFGIDEEDRLSTIRGGDINGDGFDDLIMGAQLADPDHLTSAGEVYVLPGRNTAFPATIDLADPGQEHFSVFMGVSSEMVTGASVSSGNINGDEWEDIIIGAPFAGKTFVVFGNSTGLPDTLKADELNGTNGFTIEGDNPSYQSGFFVSSSDINSDGLDDIIIGEPFSNNGAGTSYVIFGDDGGTFSATENLGTAVGENGITVIGRSNNDGSGTVIASGDIDGDTNYDLIIGAPDADPDDKNSAGEIYVLLNSDKILVSSEEYIAVPGSVALLQNYPNPFNPFTTIPFSISSDSPVSLEVFNILGRKVAVLLNNEYRTAGNHSVRFDASSLSSGLYVYRLEAGGQILNKKLVLIK